MGKVRKRYSKRKDCKLSLFLTNSLKLAGLVSVSFILYAVGFFLEDIFSEKNCPEMRDFREEQQKRRLRFLLRKLHEQHMKQIGNKKINREFYNTRKDRKKNFYS